MLQADIFGKISDALVALDRNWRYVYVNDQAGELFGRRPEDLIGKHIWTEFPEGVGQPFQLAYEKAMAEQVFIEMENYYQPWDRWFENRIYPSAEGVTIAFHEITQRKRVEEAARRATSQLTARNHILELMALDAPLPKTLTAVVAAVEAQFPDTLCSVLLVDPDGVHLSVGAAPSLPERFARALEGEPIGPFAGSCGTAVYRREPVVVQDIATDPLWDGYRSIALHEGLRACWSTPIFDASGRVLGAFGTYRRTPGPPDEDYFEAIEAYANFAAIAIVKDGETGALRESEERLRLAVWVGKVGIWSWEVRTNELVWSDHLRRIFRIEEGDDRLSLETFLHSVHPDDRAGIERALHQSIATGIDFEAECRISRADGEQQWVSGRARPEYDAHGQPIRLLGVALDITPAKRAHAETMRREAQLAEAQAIARVGSYEWDVETNRFRRSAELCRIFGLESDAFEPTLEGYLERVHPDDRQMARAAIESALRDGTPFEFEERIVRPDGAVRVLHSKGRWIRDDLGRPVMLVGTSQDVTERRQAVEVLEERVVQRTTELRKKYEELEHEVSRRKEVAELLRARNEELKAFAYTVSHDLKAPLRGIAGYAKEIERRHKDGLGERGAFCLTQILSATQNLDQLIEDLLLYARLDAETPTATEVEPARIIEGILRERQPIILEQRTEMTVNAASTPIFVWERGFRQALTNLIDNALKYSRNAKPPIVRIDASDVGEHFRVTVADNGIGFDMRYHDRMFGLFNRLVRQEEFEGTGAGLAIGRKVLDKIGGRVWAESSPGAGATFYVEVPRRAVERVAIAV